MNGPLLELLAAAKNISEENLCMSTPALVRLDAAVKTVETLLYGRDAVPPYHAEPAGYYKVTCNTGKEWDFKSLAEVQEFKDKGGFDAYRNYTINILFKEWTK